MGITKGERDELRRVVRQDFKTLQAEIKVRETEVDADIEQKVALRFEPSDDAMDQMQETIGRVVLDANRQIRDAIRAAQGSADGYRIEWAELAAPRMFVLPVKREEMRRALKADLTANVAQAKVALARKETELLKQLATGALESEEARAFLASIPTVAALVPDARLAELEESLRLTEDDT